MAKAINEEIQTSVRALITSITNYEEGTEQFTTWEKRILTTLKKSDTMYFLNTKDIRREIWKMGDKFMFQGFFKHSDYLKQCHEKYIDRNLSESDLTPRLNVVKFLLCMSQQPTTHFWKYPQEFEFIHETEEQQEVEDWVKYLNEGIERWSPVNDDSFQEQSDSEDEIDLGLSMKNKILPEIVVITETQRFEPWDFRECRKQLTNTVQHTWFTEPVVMVPPSDRFDANVGILWQQQLESEVKGMVEIQPVSVISEYKVMREVLWQMSGPHKSTVFELNVNELVPKPNVTISSVCAMTFEKFLGIFIPYIEILDKFRQFSASLEVENVSETYRSYACGVQKILNPVLQELVEIENKVRDQNETMTLLILAEKFEEIFEPVFVLKNIHDDVIVENFGQISPLQCALSLLTKLRGRLSFSVNKLEQDIGMTLYLESLRYYLTLINAWFVKNDLFDRNGEFIILNNENTSDFSLQDHSFCSDGMIAIISDQVLQIGRNISLLRLLRKYDVFSKQSGTICQEFIRRILEEFSNYYGRGLSSEDKVPKTKKVASIFDLENMGDWTDFVNMSDGFLAKAFEEFYCDEVETECEETLFQKISNITTNLFPLQNLPELVFAQILKDRFTISGLMVKNLLIENYRLDKQFEFLNHIFLFWDDLIFPFYRRLFEKMHKANSNWGNSAWLTSHLQDIIMDLYPNFYEECTVQVKDSWKQCRDSLEACTLVSLQYEIKWPLSIIITKEHIVMYKEIFQFILNIKWALYAVNHLFFCDLTKKPKKPLAIKRLKCLRFSLINILNTIQHYLFGYIFTKSRLQFELDFEKSNDLKSLISSHEDFIKSVHFSVSEIKGDRNGFHVMLKCVKMLKVMWNDLDYASRENLDKCFKMYKEAFRVIDGIVNPKFVFDY